MIALKILNHYIENEIQDCSIKDFMKFIEDDFDRVIKEHVITRTKISEDVYANKYRVEWYFLPQKAKELGVVDYIISEDCPIDDIL